MKFSAYIVLLLCLSSCSFDRAPIDPDDNGAEPGVVDVDSLLLTELPESDRVVGFWPMEGDWLDHSHSDFHGTAMGGIGFSTAGKSLERQAALFDGVDDYLEFGDNLDLLGDDFTLSAWIRVGARDDTPHHHSIVDKLRSGGNFRMILTRNGRYTFGLSNDVGDYQQFASDKVFVEAKWVHFMVVFEKDIGVKMYLNGSLDSSRGPFPIMRGDTSTPLRIGHSDNNDVFFKGEIDDVAIWDKGLQSDAVLEIYTVQGRYFDQE